MSLNSNYHSVKIAETTNLIEKEKKEKNRNIKIASLLLLLLGVFGLYHISSKNEQLNKMLIENDDSNSGGNGGENGGGGSSSGGTYEELNKMLENDDESTNGGGENGGGGGGSSTGDDTDFYEYGQLYERQFDMVEMKKVTVSGISMYCPDVLEICSATYGKKTSSGTCTNVATVWNGVYYYTDTYKNRCRWCKRNTGSKKYCITYHEYWQSWSLQRDYQMDKTNKYYNYRWGALSYDKQSSKCYNPVDCFKGVWTWNYCESRLKRSPNGKLCKGEKSPTSKPTSSPTSNPTKFNLGCISTTDGLTNEAEGLLVKQYGSAGYEMPEFTMSCNLFCSAFSKSKYAVWETELVTNDKYKYKYCRCYSGTPKDPSEDKCEQSKMEVVNINPVVTPSYNDKKECYAIDLIRGLEYNGLKADKKSTTSVGFDSVIVPCANICGPKGKDFPLFAVVQYKYSISIDCVCVKTETIDIMTKEDCTKKSVLHIYEYTT